MTDPKQPKFVPVIAGDLDDGAVFAHPGQPWDGEAALDLPPAGTYSAGTEPAHSWFSSQSFNRLFRDYGRHLEAIADQPTFEVRHPRADIPAGTADYALVGGSGTFNANTEDDLPQIYASGKYILSQVGHVAAGAGYARRWQQGSNTGASFQDDVVNAAGTTGDHAPFTNGTTAGDTPAGDPHGNPVVMGVSRTTPNVISLGSARTVTLSTDYGVSWAGATALTTDAAWSYPLVASEFNGAWLVADKLGTNYSRILTSGDLTAAAWTVIGSVSGVNSGGYIRRIICNSSVAVFLPQRGTLIGYWHAADPSVTNVLLTGSVDNTRLGWRGAWNEQIGLFLIGNQQGDLWTSTDGVTWAQIANNMAGLCVRDIAAHGRGFVISNSAVNYAIDFLDFDRKQNIRLRRLYEALAGNSGPASSFHLAAGDGRWYGARVTWVVVGGPTNYYRLEWVYSGVHAWDKNNAVGR